MCLVSYFALQNCPLEQLIPTDAAPWCGWAHPGQQLRTTQPLLPSPAPSRTRGENRKTQGKKLVGQEFNKWRKEERKIKQEMQRQPLTISHKKTRAQASLSNGYLPKNLLPFSLLSTTCYGMEQPSCQPEPAAWIVFPPNPMATHSLVTGEKMGKEKTLTWCCTRAAQQQPIHWCAINLVWVTDPKHSTTGAAMKKINPITPRISSMGL